MTFKPAKCQNCAGDLQVPDDRDSVKCMYCGSDIVVREAVKFAGGVNIENLMQLAETALNGRNIVEAHKYYSQVLEHDINNSKAWIGKAITYEFLKDYKIKVKACLKKAISCSTDSAELKHEIMNANSIMRKVLYAPNAVDLSPFSGPLSISAF